MNSIQVACKDGYVLVNANRTAYSDTSNGIAICQSNGLWDRQFLCLGK